MVDTIATPLTMATSNRSRPVRVCFVIENLLPAGTELWIVRLIQRLDRQRVQPLLCIMDGSGPTSRGLEPPDCPILRLQLSSLKTPRVVTAAWQLHRFLKQQAVDVVQVHHADPTYLAVPISRLASVPTVVQTKYDIGYWLKGWDLKLHRFLRRWIDITVANCEACRQAAVEQERAPSSQVVVIHNGIPLDELSQVPPLMTTDYRPPFQLGMVANLRPVKDPLNLLKAVEILSQRGLDIHVHFAGDGELRQRLMSEAAQRSIEHRVTLHGHIHDTVSFWRQMHVGVLCSLSEGMPHAILEAMAAGRPMIVTNTGGNCELIHDGRTGLLVPPGDPMALANSIKRLLYDAPFACQLANAARQSVTGHFGLDAMVKRFEAFYEGLGPRPVVAKTSSANSSIDGLERPQAEGLHRCQSVVR